MFAIIRDHGLEL